MSGFSSILIYGTDSSYGKMPYEKQTILLPRVRLGASRDAAGKPSEIASIWQYAQMTACWNLKVFTNRGGGKRECLKSCSLCLQAATAAQTQRCAVRRTRQSAAAWVLSPGGFTVWKWANG